MGCVVSCFYSVSVASAPAQENAPTARAYKIPKLHLQLDAEPVYVSVAIITPRDMPRKVGSGMHVVTCLELVALTSTELSCLPIPTSFPVSGNQWDCQCSSEGCRYSVLYSDTAKISSKPSSNSGEWGWGELCDGERRQPGCVSFFSAFCFVLWA